MQYSQRIFKDNYISFIQKKIYIYVYMYILQYIFDILFFITDDIQYILLYEENY